MPHPTCMWPEFYCYKKHFPEQIIMPVYYVKVEWITRFTAQDLIIKQGYNE